MISKKVSHCHPVTLSPSHLVAFSFLLFSCLAASAQAFEEQEAPAGSKARKFQFTYSATIDAIPEGAKSVDLWIPVPQDSAHQVITNVVFKAPAQPEISIEPVMHNKMAHWKLDAAEAKGLTLSMTFDCVRKEVSAQNVASARELSAGEAAALGLWLGPNKLVKVGGDFSKIADEAVKGATKPAEIAHNAYDYTVSTMKYDKPKDKTGWGQGSTQWACDARFGNCTDFHALIMSIGRTKGIPVKFEMGFPLPEADPAKPETKSGVIGGYHCWAKFYLGGVGWVPVDASEAQKNPSMAPYFFGNLTPDRVQVSSGRDVNLVPRQSGESLNFFVYPYAEADGKKIAVGKSFAFKDLE